MRFVFDTDEMGPELGSCMEARVFRQVVRALRDKAAAIEHLAATDPALQRPDNEEAREAELWLARECREVARRLALIVREEWTV